MRTAKEMKLTVGVVARERPSLSKWADAVWRPITVVGATSGLQPGSVMREGPEGTTYFMGTAEISFHRTEAQAYLQNIESRQPGLYVVLRQGSANGRPPLAWHLHMVTASPYDAQDFGDCGDDIVERVAMLPGIAATLRAFVQAHPFGRCGDDDRRELRPHLYRHDRHGRRVHPTL